MKVTFVAFGTEQLGISQLSAVLRRAGHSTSLAFNPALFADRYYLDVPALGSRLDGTARAIETAVAARPDLLAFSVLTPLYGWCLEVARAVKARLDVPVIFGGVHPSAVPEICLDNDCVDYVCVGDGEDAILRLCDALATGAGRPERPIPNLWWKDGDRLVRGEQAPFIQDLDSLPHYDKELWADELRIGDNYLTMTARGCPYRCTFCFNNFYAKLASGKYVRQRSISHVMEELSHAKSTYDVKRVEFEDDIFTVDKVWLRAFLDEYKREIDRPFQCLVHPRYVDRDIARWLKDAGCQHVQMGVQSADAEYKRKQLLRMEREVHLDDALDALAEAGVGTKLDHILGLPGEPESAQEKARALYARFPPLRVQTFWLTHLPAIELTRNAVADGHLSEAEYAAIERGETRRFRMAPNDPRAAFYQRYELLFRLIPLLPKAMRDRLRVHHIPPLPKSVAELASLALDVLNVLVRRDDEAINYLRHYVDQLGRVLLRKRKVPRTFGPTAQPPSRPTPTERAGVDTGRLFGIKKRARIDA